MADPILHIKDAYYFEIPKFMWRRDWKSHDEIPEGLAFLKEDHADVPIGEINREMSGKVVIPQPFGTLHSLYQAESGFCISKFMVLEVVAAAIIAFIFIRLAGLARSSHLPKGRFWNLFESFLVFIRDQIARPAIGHHDGDKFVPLLWTLFFFVLVCNLLGMVPWAGSATGSWSVTLALAAVTFLTVIVSGILKFGPIGFWLNQVPHMDLPIYMFPIKIGIFFIEVLGLCIKHAVLSIRLLANMVAGHLVLLAILGLIVESANASNGIYATVSVISVVGSTLLSILELFVAFLQAYVFTFLSALFISAAVHHH
ncbi:MAG: F0F1 ATP synthase subunit A [Pirellulales bacterium]